MINGLLQMIPVLRTNNLCSYFWGSSLNLHQSPHKLFMDFFATVKKFLMSCWFHSFGITGENFFHSHALMGSTSILNKIVYSRRLTFHSILNAFARIYAEGGLPFWVILGMCSQND